MNGIYDFEKYRTPHLDVEMLMEYKAKKRAKRMIILAVFAAVLMLALAILLLCNIALIDEGLLGISYIFFAVYMIAGAVVIGTVVKKKGEDSWVLSLM